VILGEKNRKAVRSINVNYFLGVALIVSCILNVYFLYGYSQVVTELNLYRQRIEQLNSLLSVLTEQLKGAVPYIVEEEVSLRFYPSIVNRTAPEYSVIYLSGMVSIGNLRQIKVRPIEVVLNFNVEATTNSNVSYNYNPKVYSLKISSEKTNYAECPFSIYPIYVADEPVTFKIQVIADVMWNGERISRAFATATFHVDISGGQ